mmetsp:Transcript_6550/g.12163  ORF Transcript_6550/g.12163 Transcript_6550/m.12163 type:complete len:140 (+) Transcript_6550:44-463(+)
MTGVIAHRRNRQDPRWDFGPGLFTRCVQCNALSLNKGCRDCRAVLCKSHFVVHAGAGCLGPHRALLQPSPSNQGSASIMRARWRHEIGAALQCRKAVMLRAVLPKVPARQRWLVEGHMDDAACKMLPPIEEDDEVGGET